MLEEKFRCHPSIIVEKLGGIITAIFFIVIASIDDIKDMILEDIVSYYYLIILGVIGLLTIILIYNIVVWSKTFISIEGNTIIVQRNTISSKVKTYGIQNISNVNLEQNIFEQIVGTFKIKIDTDSLSTADNTDIEIILSKKDAYEFKNKVIQLMNNEKLKHVDEDKINLQDDIMKEDLFNEENIEYDIVYSVNDVLKHCFYNFSVFGFIFNLAVIAVTLLMVLQVDSLGGIVAIGLIIITSGISILKFFVGDLFKYYNFSIKRLEDKLYISYGLFKKRKFTVPVNRINAINIKQSALSRIFKRYNADIVTIGVGNDESEGSQILLSAKKEAFSRNMKILLPELALGENINLQRQPKKHFIIKLIEMLIVTIISTIILYCIYNLDYKIPGIIFFVIWLCIILMGVIIIQMNYITKGFYIGEENLVISWGVFSKKISVIKYKKVQYIDIKENPISSKLNLCKGEIYILASLGNSTRALGYYELALFEKLGHKIIN
ncbi:MAG: PH domain-containing protein [Terrisporobacter sp.]